MSYLKRQSKQRAPQSAPIPGSGQAPNSAGGFAWAVDDWARLRRFLILGSEGGSYYAGEWKLTRENAEAVERCLAADGARTVAEIVAISEGGRAPKNDPAIFALAMAAGAGDETTRQGGARGAAAGVPHLDAPVPVRDASSRASAAGAARSGARSAAGTPAARRSRSPTRRSSTASARA